MDLSLGKLFAVAGKAAVVAGGSSAGGLGNA